jgi:hypothetical protein
MVAPLRDYNISKIKWLANPASKMLRFLR